MADEITLVADSQSFVNAFKACDDAMKRTNEFFGKTQEALSKVGTTFESASASIKAAADDIQRIQESLITVDKSFANISNTFGTLGSKLDGAGKGIQSAFQGLYGKIKSGSSVADVAKEVNEKIKTSITSGTGAGSEKAWTGLDSLKSLMLGLKSVQKLDRGGMVAKLSKTFLTLSNALNIISKLPMEGLTKLDTMGANEKVTGIKLFLQSLTTMLSTEFKGENLQVFSAITSSLSKLGYFFKTLESFSSASKKTTFDSSALVTSIRSLIIDLGSLANAPEYSKFIELANAMEKVSLASKNISGSTKKATSALNSLTTTTSTSGLNLLAGGFRSIVAAFIGGSVIYSTVRAIKQSITELIDLESIMRRINTIARESEASLAGMTTGILQLSQATGIKKTDLAEALYEINSATIKGSDAMLVLRASAYSAVAGFTETKKVAELISKILNAYGESANKAEYYSDVLFKTVERGINPMSELVQYLGNVITVAAGAGISFEEVSAAVATLTDMGYKTNVAVTSLNSAILKFAKGNKQLNKLFQDSGYASSAAAVRVIGLKRAFDLIRDATGGATEKLAELGFNYRDIRAASVLASKSLALYQTNMDEIVNKTNVAGATQAAFVEIQKSLKQVFDETSASISTFISNITNSTQSLSIFRNVLLGVKTLFEEVNSALIKYNENMNLSFGQSVLVKIVSIGAALIGVLSTVLLFKKIGTLLAGLTISSGLIVGTSTLAKQALKIGTYFAKIGIPHAVILSALNLSKIFYLIVNRITIWVVAIEKTYSWMSELLKLTGSWSYAIKEIWENINSIPKLVRAVLVTIVSAVGASLDILTLGIFGFTEQFGDAMTNLANRILGIKLEFSVPEENQGIASLREQVIALNKEFANTKKGTEEYSKLIYKFNMLKEAIAKVPGASKELGESLKNLQGKIKTVQEPSIELEKSNRDLLSNIIKELEDAEFKKMEPIKRIVDLEYKSKITERALSGFSGFNTEMIESSKYINSFVELIRKTQGEFAVGGFLENLKSYRDLIQEIGKDYAKIEKSAKDAFNTLAKTFSKEKSISEIIKENLIALEKLKQNATIKEDLKILFEISNITDVAQQKEAYDKFFADLKSSFGADSAEYLRYVDTLKKGMIYQNELSKGTQKLTKEMESLSKSIEDSIMDIDKQILEYEGKGLSIEDKKEKAFNKVTIQYEKLQEYIIPGMTPPKEEIDKFKSLYGDYFELLKKSVPGQLGTAIRETSAVEMGGKEAFDIIAKTVYRENKDNVKDIKDNTDDMLGHLISFKGVLESIDKNAQGMVNKMTGTADTIITSSSL